MIFREQYGGDGGFVLVAVLMGIAVLAGIAAALTISSRTNIQFTNTYEELAVAEAAAAAGVALATLRIVAMPDRAANPDAGLVCEFQGSVLTISIVDEGGKVDLNAASPRLILGLITAILSDERRASEVVDAITDFIDQDDDDRLSKRSEVERYSAIEGPTPKNTWLAMVDELEQVAGLTQPLADGRSLFLHLRPFVTVWSRRSGIDRNVASKELLALLARGNDGSGPEPDLPTDARFFTITAKAVTPSGGRFSREVTIERDPTAKNGYHLRSFLARPFEESDYGLDIRTASPPPSCSLLAIV